MIDNQMWWLLAAVMIFAAIFSGLRLRVIDQREHQQRLRLDGFRGPINQLETVGNALPWYQHLGSWFAPILGVVEQQRLLKLLAQAGIKGKTSLANFIAMRLLAAFTLVLLTGLVLEWNGLFPGMLYRLPAFGMGFMLGWRLPDIVLNRLIKRRRLRLEQGMPDALDLLVVCAESGLSLNQSIEEISKQLRLSNKDIADEFATTSAEMQITPDFGQALDNMVERTGLTDLGGLVTTLKQSVKFGTPLADSLRTIATEMRAERHARIEERAARLPVLLAVPMMLFILPCLMLIIGTPVVLRLIDTFNNLSFGGFSGVVR